MSLIISVPPEDTNDNDNHSGEYAPKTSRRYSRWRIVLKNHNRKTRLRTFWIQYISNNFYSLNALSCTTQMWLQIAITQ